MDATPFITHDPSLAPIAVPSWIAWAIVHPSSVKNNITRAGGSRYVIVHRNDAAHDGQSESGGYVPVEIDGIGQVLAGTVAMLCTRRFQVVVSIPRETVHFDALQILEGTYDVQQILLDFP
jgi:hypothetical protein